MFSVIKYAIIVIFTVKQDAGKSRINIDGVGSWHFKVILNTIKFQKFIYFKPTNKLWK